MNTNKQAELKVRSLRICLFTLHTYLCVYALIHPGKDLVYTLPRYLQSACHLPALPIHCDPEVQCYNCICYKKSHTEEDEPEFEKSFSSYMVMHCYGHTAETTWLELKCEVSLHNHKFELCQYPCSYYDRRTWPMKISSFPYNTMDCSLHIVWTNHNVLRF